MGSSASKAPSDTATSPVAVENPDYQLQVGQYKAIRESISAINGANDEALATAFDKLTEENKKFFDTHASSFVSLLKDLKSNLPLASATPVTQELTSANANASTINTVAQGGKKKRAQPKMSAAASKPKRVTQKKKSTTPKKVKAKSSLKPKRK